MLQVSKVRDLAAAGPRLPFFERSVGPTCDRARQTPAAATRAPPQLVAHAASSAGQEAACDGAAAGTGGIGVPRRAIVLLGSGGAAAAAAAIAVSTALALAPAAAAETASQGAASPCELRQAASGLAWCDLREGDGAEAIRGAFYKVRLPLRGSTAAQRGAAAEAAGAASLGLAGWP
jgi:hypothetical protein